MCLMFFVVVANVRRYALLPLHGRSLVVLPRKLAKWTAISNPSTRQLRM